MARTTREAMVPPMTETTMKSATPRTSAPTAPGSDWTTISATSDSPRAATTELTMAPMMFCPRRESRRQVHDRVPVWSAVDSRLPRGPKTLPRRPMAAGMNSRRPGLLRRVSANRAKVKPVIRLVVAATRPGPRGSGRRRWWPGRADRRGDGGRDGGRRGDDRAGDARRRRRSGRPGPGAGFGVGAWPPPAWPTDLGTGSWAGNGAGPVGGDGGATGPGRRPRGPVARLLRVFTEQRYNVRRPPPLHRRYPRWPWTHQRPRRSTDPAGRPRSGASGPERWPSSCCWPRSASCWPPAQSDGRDLAAPAVLADDHHPAAAPDLGPRTRRCPMSGLTLTSPLFAPGERPPECRPPAWSRGRTVFPDLAWSGVPVGAVRSWP